MSVVGTDMLLMLSVSAAAGDTTAGTPATSLGDQVSTTAITTATIGNLFDDVSAAEASAGDTEYRCVFVKNNHATDTAIGVKVDIQSQVALGASIETALDNIAISAKGSASAQAAVIASEGTAPSGVGTFGTTQLTIGDMGPGTVKGVWIKRVVSASTAALASDGATIRISGEG